ncbi:MAG: polysaccharide biosynthesis C-terminal domain-containing protein [Clostridiales bacterium]|nr:polysaccharide biosynthesis C-terminal domain-containing protein [Clostridiales bacterium]
MEKGKKSFVKGAAILGLAGLIVKIIGAFYRIPLTNILQRGDLDGMVFYESAYPYYSWLLVISSAGFPTAISKLVSERAAVGDKKGATAVFKTAFLLLTVIGAVTTLLLFTCSGLISNLSGIPGARYSLMALAPALIIVSIMCAYRGYLQGMQMMTGTALSQVTEQIGKLIASYSLALIFVKLYPQRPELWAMGTLIGISISEVLGLLVIWLVYRKSRLNLPSYNLEGMKLSADTLKSFSKRLLAIAIPITIGASIMPITGIADSIFIRRLLEGRYLRSGFELELAGKMAENGYVALRSYVTPLINMPAVLTLALSMSLVPAIAPMKAARDRRGIRKVGTTGMKLAMIIGAPCAVGLFVLGGPIMAMLYSKVAESVGPNETYYLTGFLSQILNMRPGQEVSIYALAGGIMQISAIGVLFLSLVQTLTGVIQGMGKQNIPVAFLIAGGTVKVVSMILLMRFTRLGILGAAISTTLCYLVAGIGDAAYTISHADIKLNWFDTFAKPLLAAIIMGVVVYFAYTLLYKLGHPRITTIVSIFIGAVVYIGLLWVFRIFNRDDLGFMPGSRKLAKFFKVKMQ